jgi:cytochrome c5
MSNRTRAVLAAACLGTFMASGLILGEVKGDEKKGKESFKNSCKTCHGKGAEAGEVTPLKKTMSQWERYFAKGEHKKGQEKLTDVVSAEELADISAFLVAHAADSDQPETCG